ncbi:hypothetical protein [Roseovarius phycicola]|uniref:Uncharacterized protein n=1 Tax=Roseovarius phycicola TaxID=3080976 RepID=A0ABZ2HHK3_9RHOB
MSLIWHKDFYGGPKRWWHGCVRGVLVNGKLLNSTLYAAEIEDLRHLTGGIEGEMRRVFRLRRDILARRVEKHRVKYGFLGSAGIYSSALAAPYGGHYSFE